MFNYLNSIRSAPTSSTISLNRNSFSREMLSMSSGELSSQQGEQMFLFTVEVEQESVCDDDMCLIVRR